MAEEILEVKNFAGIREARISLSRVNVFIGPQASGKSVCAKLLFYFRAFLIDALFSVSGGEALDAVARKAQADFLEYFPANCWSDESFEVRYTFDFITMTVSGNRADNPTVNVTIPSHLQDFTAQATELQATWKLKTTHSQRSSLAMDSFVQDKLAERMSPTERAIFDHESYFIPATRTFIYDVLGMAFSIIKRDLPIDPLLALFGAHYQRAIAIGAAGNRPDFDLLVTRLIRGEYRRENDIDYVVHGGNRRVDAQHSSSGQQAVIPLALVLGLINSQEDIRSGSTIFVEEPEAHLYPSAQRDIVHLLVAALNFSSPDSHAQYVITTHSPYILTALNNLVYAGKIKRDFPDKAEAVDAVMDNAVTIDPSGVRAYMFADGGVTSIIDEESQLVVAEALDGVSGALANEFQSLMDIEFGDDEE